MINKQKDKMVFLVDKIEKLAKSKKVQMKERSIQWY